MLIDTTPLVNALRQTRLFRHLPEATLTELAGQCRAHRHRAGELILPAYEQHTALHVVIAGELVGTAHARERRQDVPLTTFEPGEVIGLSACINGDRNPLQVVARTTAVTLSIPLETVRTLCHEYPAVAWELTMAMAIKLRIVAEAVGLRHVPLRHTTLDAELIKRLPKSVIMRNQAIPLEITEFSLVVGITDPANLLAYDEIRLHFPHHVIHPALITESDFQWFAKEAYPKLAPGTGSLVEATVPGVADLLTQDLVKDLELTAIDFGDQAGAVPDLAHSAEAPPIIRLSNNILALAIQKGASDIHLEPQQDGLLLRLRVDGLLEETQVLPKAIQPAVISRLKITANLDISEQRLPQDGRISVRLHERVIDFRVSSVPTKYGEKLVLRVLDKNHTLLGLDKLVSHPEIRARIREMINQPYGIILVTGPTGSGKTTTLYAALAELNTPDVNIATAEDPIEYEIPRINQVQVNHDIGLDFARILRAFLRQDPDIILVGETRDLETAKTSIEASLTGHLVFTTLHTNNAASAFTRLVEMGIEPFLIASATIGVIAQRLVRRLCLECREAYTPDAETLRYLGWPQDKPATFYRTNGCDRCHHTGYKGRAGIYEVLRLNNGLRKMVSQGAEAVDIALTARTEGMLDMRDYSLYLLEQGTTTVEEVLSVVMVSE